MMKAPTRILSLTLLGVIALAVGVWLWCVAGPEMPAEARDVLPSEVLATPANPGVELVPIEESSRWLERLSSGREIRIRVGEKETPASHALPNVGGFDSSERAYVEECLRARVDVFSRQFEEHYTQTSWKSEELRRLEEMKVNSAFFRYKAYDQAFVNGEYFVIPATDSTPDLGPTVACLNMGGTCSGKQVKVIIVADKKKYQLDILERELNARRRDWLARVVSEFNDLPFEQREAAILRLNANRPEDAAWREATFPKGVRLNDREKLLLL
jgi:hypothetical protein